MTLWAEWFTIFCLLITLHSVGPGLRWFSLNILALSEVYIRTRNVFSSTFSSKFPSENEVLVYRIFDFVHEAFSISSIACVGGSFVT